MQRDLKSASFFVVLLLVSVSLFAQPKINDPYTILGLGNLNNLNFASLSAMPGLTATYHDGYHMNIQNPAASSFLQQTAFEGGWYYEYKTMKTPSVTDGVHAGNINYLALGFPLYNGLNKLNERKKRPYSLGMTFSLTPYSAVGYDLVKTDSLANIGNIQSTFEGNGGTYKFTWGNSFRYENMAIGLNLGYLFGKQTSEHWDYFIDIENEFRNRFYNETFISGFVWNIGALYEYVLPQKLKEGEDSKTKKPKYRLTLGAYGNSKNTVNTSSDIFYERRQVLGASLSDVDTIYAGVGESGKITLPAELGVGLMFSKDGKFKIGLDYTTSNWSEYTNNVNPTSLNNSFRIAVGAEILPKSNATFKNYRNKITYRLGGFYQKDPRSIDGFGAIQKKAVTFGLGLPLQPDLDNRKFISFVNVTGEIGQYGDENYLQQTYYKLTIGFTLNDNLWFYKSKYN